MRRISRLVVPGLVALSLAMVPAASAQNGFPAASPAVDQYEAPANGGNGGAGNSGNSGDEGRGSTASRDRDDRRRGCNRSRASVSQSPRDCPRGGAGPDTASGVAGARGELGAPLPFAESEGGRLPFTGLDLSLLAILGLLLAGAGFSLRAATRVRTARSQ